MDKNYDIIKIITHADGGEEYSKNVSEYPSNEDSVAVRGYGVDANDPENAQKQFDTMAKYHGNEGKNQYIQYMMSFLKETAPDAWTAMEITDQVLDPLKDEYMILIGVHKKDHQKSDFHTHNFVGTTNIETGKMLHPTNKLNFDMAQRMANIIQKPVELVIEKRIKLGNLDLLNFRWEHLAKVITTKAKTSRESSIRIKTQMIKLEIA